MRIALGSDHGGFEYKSRLIMFLKREGHEVIDCGTETTESCHYPLFAFKVGELVASNQADRGILVCTTGEGIAIAANKVKGVRCGIGFNDDVCRLMVEHNNANVIAFSQKYMEYPDVEKRANIFLNTTFTDEGRHLTRVNLIKEFENK